MTLDIPDPVPHGTGPEGTTVSSTVFAGDAASEVPEEVRRAIDADLANLTEEPDDTEHDSPTGWSAADDWYEDLESATTDDGPIAEEVTPEHASQEAPDASTDALDTDADTLDTDGDTPDDPVEDPVDDNRDERRLRWAAAATTVVVLLGLCTMFAPFYSVTIPALELRLPNGQSTQLQPAQATVSAWDLTHQSGVQAPTQLARSAGPRPEGAAGIPKPHATLLLLGILAVAGLVVRLTAVPAASVVAGFFAMKQLTALRSLVESNRGDAEWITPLWGVSLTALLIGLAMSLAVGLTVQVFVVNLRERQEVVAEAEAAGVDPPATVFGTITQMVGRQVARLVDSHRATDADADGRIA